MTAKIVAALAQLDPKNDNHWTDEGNPRMDTVKLFAGDSTITRDAVTAAAPGFSRANFTLPDDKAAGSSAPAVSGAGSGEPAAGEPAASASPTGGDNAEDVSGDPGDTDPEPQSPTPQPQQSAVAAAFSETQQRLKDAAAAKTKADQEYAKAIVAHDASIVAVEAKPTTLATALSEYFAQIDRSNARKVEKLIEAQELRKAGFDVKADVRARIDKAMERKRTRGATRPNNLRKLQR